MASLHWRPRGAALGCVALACAVALLLPSPVAAQRPNFLHVLTDDQTIDSIAHMRQTKRLLGRHGTTFTNYHATQPFCCPSRASFLTGQYPHNHGVLDNYGPHGFKAMDFSRTLYTAMHEAGYRTGWIGKLLNSVGFEGQVPEPGFDEWLVPLAGTHLSMTDYLVSDNGRRRQVSGHFQNYFYGSRAKDFIGADDGRPFLLTLSLFSPHWTPCPGTLDQVPLPRCPPVPAPEDLGTVKREPFPFPEGIEVSEAERRTANQWWRRELESLQSVDRVVGALVRELRDRGELDNTYVIFQSDNGLLHGEHGIFDKNVPWDRSVRVPLLIRGPGFGAGEERDDLTANVDLPATILDAGGVAPPRPPDGYSLLGEHRRRVLLLERALGRFSWTQVKTASNWTFWRNRNGTHRLFNLDRDPGQTRNRFRAAPRLAERMGRRLDRFAACANFCP